MMCGGQLHQIHQRSRAGAVALVVIAAGVLAGAGVVALVVIVAGAVLNAAACDLFA